MVFSINNARKSEYPKREKNEPQPSHYIQKNNAQWITDMDVKAKEHNTSRRTKRKKTLVNVG